MNLQEFDEQIQSTNLMQGETLYHLLGLISEIGECLEHIEIPLQLIVDKQTDEHYYLAKMIHEMQLLGTRAASYKRQMRDHGVQYKYHVHDKSALQKELCDVRWYAISSSMCVDMSSEDVAAYLKQKLQDRKERGMLQGEGDNR